MQEYKVIKNIASGECSIIDEDSQTYEGYIVVYGPETKENCETWCQDNCQ